MNAIRRALGCALAVAAIAAGALWAGTEGRISGRVLDSEGKPLQGAEVVLVNPQSGGEDIKITDKKGKVVFLVLDATFPYGVRISKEGFQPIQEKIKPNIGGSLRKEWTLVPATDDGGTPGEISGKAGAIRLYNAGATANNEGDRATAIAKFLESVEVDPEFVAGYQALIGLYAQTGDFSGVLDAANRLLAFAPEDSMALGARYDALLELGRTQEATAALEEMKVNAPGKTTAVRLFNRGATALREVGAEAMESALPDLKLAVEMDPSLDVARSALATVYLGLKDYQRAAENAEVLREAKPDDAVALSLLYDAYLGLGEKEKAAATFAELQAISPEKAANAFYNQGVAQLDRGEAEQALASFDKVLAAYPEHVKVHYMRGLGYLNTSKMDLAKASLEKFLELAPDDPDAETAKQMLSALK